MAREREDRTVRVPGEKGGLAGGAYRITKVHVVGPSDVAIYYDHQGRSTGINHIRLHDGDSMDIDTVQVVDQREGQGGEGGVGRPQITPGVPRRDETWQTVRPSIRIWRAAGSGRISETYYLQTGGGTTAGGGVGEIGKDSETVPDSREPPDSHGGGPMHGGGDRAGVGEQGVSGTQEREVDGLPSILTLATVLAQHIVRYFGQRPDDKFDGDQKLWDMAQTILKVAELENARAHQRESFAKRFAEHATPGQWNAFVRMTRGGW